MSQVPAITNETPKTPEPSEIQRSNDDFLELLEKEKTKSPIPSMLPVNFQSFFNVPLDLSAAGKEAGKIEKFDPMAGYTRQDPFVSGKTGLAAGVKEKQQTQSTNAADPSKAAQAEQVKFTAGAISKLAAGEIDLSSDLYNAVIEAKNRVDSLKSIDVDDVISQVKDKIKLMLNGGLTELSMELKPENLGTVLMKISSNKGVITVSIYADQAAKKVLEENIAELKLSLKQANLNIESLNVLSEDKKKHNKGETG